MGENNLRGLIKTIQKTILDAQVLMQQRDLVDAQIERLHAHMEQQSSSAAADAAAPASSSAPGPPLSNGPNNGSSSGGGTAPNGGVTNGDSVAGGNAQAAPPSGAKAVAPEQCRASVRHQLCMFYSVQVFYNNTRVEVNL